MTDNAAPIVMLSTVYVISDIETDKGRLPSGSIGMVISQPDDHTYDVEFIEPFPTVVAVESDGVQLCEDINLQQAIDLLTETGIDATVLRVANVADLTKLLRRYQPGKHLVER